MNVRHKLKEQLKVIPKSVTEGGVMTVSLWKAKVDHGSRLVAQPRASELEMERVLDDLRNFK